jgi:hypothetical protein
MSQIVTGQKTKIFQTSMPKRPFETSNIGVALAAGTDVPLLTMSTFGVDRIFFEVVSQAAIALTGFKVKAKPTAGAPVVTLFSTTQAFTSPQGIMVASSGDLTLLAGNAVGYCILDTKGIAEIELFASSAGNAILDCYMGGV